MPEGHTIHRLARDQTKRFVGQRLQVSSPQGRFRDGARLLEGLTLTQIEAYGKHLFYWWDNEILLHVHLGLYGRYRNHKSPPPAPRGEVRLRVIGKEFAFDLNGPSQCGLIDVAQRETIVARLGPDPLRSDADPEQAWRRISQSRAAAGRLLLDQSVIAGVGNIFRAELLYLTGIHPNRPGKSISREEFNEMWGQLTGLLRRAVKYNRIITADPTQVGRSYGRMQRDERLLVYQKQKCGRCQAAIQKWNQAARTIYACPKCQL